MVQVGDWSTTQNFMHAIVSAFIIFSPWFNPIELCLKIALFFYGKGRRPIWATLNLVSHDERRQLGHSPKFYDRNSTRFHNLLTVHQSNRYWKSGVGNSVHTSLLCITQLHRVSIWLYLMVQVGDWSTTQNFMHAIVSAFIIFSPWFNPIELCLKIALFFYGKGRRPIWATLNLVSHDERRQLGHSPKFYDRNSTRFHNLLNALQFNRYWLSCVWKTHCFYMEKGVGRQDDVISRISRYK